MKTHHALSGQFKSKKTEPPTPYPASHSVDIGLRFTTPVAGTMPASEKTIEKWIESTVEDADKRQQYVELSKKDVDKVKKELKVDHIVTFRRNGRGEPFIMDYMVKAALKEATTAMHRAEVLNLKGGRERVNTGVFVYPRFLQFYRDGKVIGDIEGRQEGFVHTSFPRQQSSFRIVDIIEPGAEIHLKTDVLGGVFPPDLYRRLWETCGRFVGIGGNRAFQFGRFEITKWAVNTS